MAKVGRPRQMKDRQPKMVYLDEPERRYYQDLANKTGRSFSEVCRDTLREAMRKYNPTTPTNRRRREGPSCWPCL